MTNKNPESAEQFVPPSHEQMHQFAIEAQLLADDIGWPDNTSDPNHKYLTYEGEYEDVPEVASKELDEDQGNKYVIDYMDIASAWTVGATMASRAMLVFTRRQRDLEGDENTALQHESQVAYVLGAMPKEGTLESEYVFLKTTSRRVLDPTRTHDDPYDVDKLVPMSPEVLEEIKHRRQAGEAIAPTSTKGELKGTPVSAAETEALIAYLKARYEESHDEASDEDIHDELLGK